MTQCIMFNGGTYNPPGRSQIQRTIGPYRLASALEDAGYTSFVLDYVINLTTDEIIEAIRPHIGPDTLWVGFSSSFYWRNNDFSKANSIERPEDVALNQMYFADYKEIEKIINFVKSNSFAQFVYGGSQAPFYTVDSNIDYYVYGHADATVVMLTDVINGKNVELATEDITINGKVCKIVDSSKYGEPTMNDASTHWWRKDFNVLPGEALPLELARGCIFKCSFCNFPLTKKDKGTYTRSISELRDELIKTYEVHGTKDYYFTDDTLNDDNSRMEELHKMMTSLPFKPTFTAHLRIDLIHKHPEQAQLLAEAGLIGTFFGIETLHPKSAVSIGKGLHPTKVKDRLYQLGEVWKDKVNIDIGFILGLPYDDMQYFYELITWSIAKDNPAAQIQFYPLSLFYYSGQKPELDQHSSEFSINPDVYGYQFPTGNITDWKLPSQSLNYKMCKQISDQYNDLRKPVNRISSFAMTTTMNIGVPLSDILTMPEVQLVKKYNIPQMNQQKIAEYKRLTLNK